MKTSKLKVKHDVEHYLPNDVSTIEYLAMMALIFYGFKNGEIWSFHIA